MNLASPKVSIIIPTYNRISRLQIAINSCINQSFENIEIIVINDGGQNVSEIINFFNDNRIKYINLEKNVGRAEARNIGIRSSVGTYICYLDDDDVLYKDHIKILFNFIEKNNFDVVYSNSYRVLESNLEKSIHYNKKINYRQIFVRNSIPILSFMHKKDCLDIIGYYDNRLRYYEDWDLIIRLSKKFSFHNINEVTSEFYFRNEVFEIDKETLILKDMYYIYKKYSNCKRSIYLHRRLYIEKTFTGNAINNFLLSEVNIGLEFIKNKDFVNSSLVFKNLTFYFPEVDIYKYYYFISKMKLNILLDKSLKKSNLYKIIKDNIKTNKNNNFIESVINILPNNVYFYYLYSSKNIYVFLSIYNEIIIFLIYKYIFEIKKQMKKLI